MNLQQLQYFITAIDHGSFAEASRIHFLTAAGAAKAIHALEKELAVTLVYRDGKNIKATEAGIEMYRQATLILDRANALQKKMLVYAEREEPTKKLLIACANAFEHNALLPYSVFKKFKKLYPEVALNIVAANSNYCVSLVMSQNIDGALLVGETKHPDLFCYRLWKLAPGIVLSSQHPLTKKHFVTLEALANYPIATPAISRHLIQCIAKLFFENGLNPVFQTLYPSSRAYSDFALKHLGVILTFGRYKKKLPEQLTYRTLNLDESVSFYACYIFRKSYSNPLNKIMVDFLRASNR